MRIFDSHLCTNKKDTRGIRVTAIEDLIHEEAVVAEVVVSIQELL